MIIDSYAVINDHVNYVSVSKQASNTKTTADVVKAALDETERAQSVAMDAIQLATNNTKGTMDLLNSVSLTLVLFVEEILSFSGCSNTA